MKNPIKNYTTLKFSAICLLLIYTYTFCTSGYTKKTSHPKTATMISSSAHEFNLVQRALWEDHINWTRNVIFCIVDSLPGKDQAIKRLLRNQSELGLSLKPYYGRKAGENFTQLLSKHVHITLKLIDAIEQSNTEEYNKMSDYLEHNGSEITSLLCNLNPHWNKYSMNLMINMHNKIATDEIILRVKSRYNMDVIVNDRFHKKTMDMADFLTKGIITQFPKKFLK